jgi:hypothetical protein
MLDSHANTAGETDVRYSGLSLHVMLVVIVNSHDGTTIGE